jgi:hypothetical protein
VPFLVLVQVVVEVLRRPRLWSTAVRQYRRLVPRGWWRRAPFLPMPPRPYLRFRFVTAYGGGEVVEPLGAARDVVSYLEWCRSFPAVAGASHRR